MTRWIVRAVEAGGALCALLAALLFVLGIPLVGGARPSYAAFATVTLLLFTLTCFGVAAVVAARSREPMALYAAVMLAMLGGGGAPYADVLAARPGLFVPARLGVFLLIALVVGFLILFPTGRPVPRWAWAPFLVWATTVLVVMLATPPYPAGNPPDRWGQLMAIGFLGGLASQGWRWRLGRDAVARAQTRWVLVGLAVAIVCMVAGAFLPAMAPTGARAGLGFAVTTLGTLAIPVTIGIAVTRYRLWDVDVFINRAVVYSAVAVILIGVYLGVVLGAELVLAGRGQTVLSLAGAGFVAVAFQPLRRTLQHLVNRIMYGDRDDPAAVLRRLGDVLDETVSGGSVLPEIARTLASALRLPYAAVALRDGQVFAQGRERDEVGDLLRLPLAYQGENVGELRLAPRGRRDPFLPKDLELLRELTVHIGAAAHAVLLDIELRRSRERLVSARAEERRRLRRDLHDGLAPQLAGLALKLEAARNRAPASAGLRQTLAELAGQTRNAIADLRRLVYALRPPALDEIGLVAAIGQAGEAATTGLLEFEFSRPAELPPLPAAVEEAAYRIAQEALNNVVRHAHARRCMLKLAMNGDDLMVEVTDDGSGITPGGPLGIGLRSMRERTEELEGCLEVSSVPGQGTRLVASLPCAGRIRS